MKMKKSIKSVLSAVLVVMMLCSVIAPVASAVSFDKTALGSDTYLTSKTDYTVAPGITESHITTNNSTGSNQVQGYALEVDMSNPTVSVISSYKDYDATSWGFQKVRDQAYAVEKKLGVNVVAGVNGDFFNMQTGAPTGTFVMNGTVYKTNNKWNYFAILNDGTPVIGSGKLNTSNVKECIGGPCILVRDGAVADEAIASDYGVDQLPRTAIGITADGNIVLFVADGRQAPTSCGQTFEQLANAMIAMGCVDALALDGGGSSTFISQHEGEDELVCRNSPSDGAERTVSTALLVCSSAKPSGEFDHAALSPNNAVYTPGSTVTFTAKGVDSSGYSAELPADGTFALADESYGTIDPVSGKFVSNGTTGTVTVNYMSGGEVCGTVTIEIVIPDDLYVASNEQAVGPGVTTDFGIVAKYENRDVIMKDDDIEWSIIDQYDENSCYALFYADQFDSKYLTASTYGTYSSGKKNKANVSRLDLGDNEKYGDYVILKITALVPEKGTKYKIDYIKNKYLQSTDGTIVADGLYTTLDTLDLNGVAGEFSGTTFTGAEENAYNTLITATLKCNTELSLELTVFVGSKIVPLYDFEYTTDAEEAAASDTLQYISSYDIPTYSATWLGTTENLEWLSETYGDLWNNASGSTNMKLSAVLESQNMPFFVWPNAALADANNETAKGTIVSAADGEPVRFGEHSMKIHFDYSSFDYSSNANFYIRSTDTAWAFEGSPTAIGMWVYAPEGTTGYALYINCANRVADGDYVGMTYTTGDKIDWVGWKYLELDLTGVNEAGNNVGGGYEPYGEGAGCGIFWISYQPSNMGKPSEDTIYIDDMVLIYGANTTDTTNPVVSYIGSLTDSIVDGETVYDTNTVSLKAVYADTEDKYMTGIDDAATKMYIDGVDVTDLCYINEGDDEIYLYDAYLANGVHCLEVEVADAYGNVTKEMRYFTVAGEDTNTELDIVEVDGAPVLGEVYTMAIVANDISDVESAEIEIKALSDFTKYWNDFEIVAADGYELDGDPVFNEVLSTISFKVVKSDDSSSDGKTLVYINVNIPTDVPEGLEVTYRVSKGIVTYASDKGDKYISGFSGKLTTTCLSPFNVVIDTMVVGADGGYITVTDVDGNAAEGVNVYCGETLLGVTDANGQIYTSEYVGAITEFTVYAEKDGQVSFEYSTQSFNAGGDSTGAPSNIILNATAAGSTSQNISWMSSPIASADTAVVKYATKADYEANGEDAFTTFSGESCLAEINASGSIKTNYAVRFNSAVITGLAPDTEYVYIVGDGTNMSALKTFSTIRSGASTNFFVMGDTQSADTSNVAAIFSQLAASDVDYSFGIQTGDAVDNAGSYSYWDGIGQVFSGDFIGETPVVHVLGNHEYTGDLVGVNSGKYFNLPGATDEEAPLCYSVQYGNVYVAVINYASLSDYEEAAEWLVKDASNAKACWKVLAMHQPAYFTNAGGNVAELTEVISSAVDAADIDFVFSGHDHSYARTYPVTDGVQADDGAVYFICAATSAEKGYQITTLDGIHAVATDEYNSIYLTVSTTDTTFDVTVWNYDGENHTVFDSYSATKAITCTEEGLHDYSYADGFLTCNVCGYSDSVDGYTGFATDTATGSTMYFIGGNAQTGWVSVGTDHYYFNDKGLAQTGEVTLDGHTYTFGADGKMTLGSFEKNSDGTYTYYINGEKQRGWFEIDGNWYYFSRSNGFKSLKGEATVEGMSYTFSNSCKLIKGAWNTTSQGTCYYWGPNPVTGLQEISGHTYYFDPADTYMLVNESVEIDGEIFSFGEDGKFVHNGAHADSDGDGKCDECSSGKISRSFLQMLIDFFQKIKLFFQKLFK